LRRGGEEERRRGGEEERRRGGLYELREDTNLGLMVILEG
jgi:hypothetical protein